MSPDNGSWARRRLTLEALASLVAAMALVRFVPFRSWRHMLPKGPSSDGSIPGEAVTEARLLAAHVDRAAWRLPGKAKCLPRAIALSRMLAARSIGHTLVIAARPSAHEASQDRLHAWVEIGGTIVLGDLPGPWLQVWRNG